MKDACSGGHAGDNTLFVPNLDAEDVPFFAGYHGVNDPFSF